MLDFRLLNSRISPPVFQSWSQICEDFELWNQETLRSSNFHEHFFSFEVFFSQIQSHKGKFSAVINLQMPNSFFKSRQSKLVIFSKGSNERNKIGEEWRIFKKVFFFFFVLFLGNRQKKMKKFSTKNFNWQRWFQIFEWISKIQWSEKWMKKIKKKNMFINMFLNKQSFSNGFQGE